MGIYNIYIYILCDVSEETDRKPTNSKRTGSYRYMSKIVEYPSTVIPEKMSDSVFPGHGIV